MIFPFPIFLPFVGGGKPRGPDKLELFGCVVFLVATITATAAAVSSALIQWPCVSAPPPRKTCDWIDVYITWMATWIGIVFCALMLTAMFFAARMLWRAYITSGDRRE